MDNTNLRYWESMRDVPQTAQKEIGGGRLKGMTDINPMWRIKILTEHFGPVGEGWYYEILEKRIEEGSEGQKSAFVDINLYVKYKEGWSKPIPGTGGSMFIENEKRGPHTNDECFKMALTDALSVSCKALGIGANIYWSKDNTKYNDQKKANYNNNETNEIKVTTEDLEQLAARKHVPVQQLFDMYKKHTGKTASEVKFISQEYKQKYYAMLETMPDK